MESGRPLHRLLPMVEDRHRSFWDGGIGSNTPLRTCRSGRRQELAGVLRGFVCFLRPVSIARAVCRATSRRSGGAPAVKDHRCIRRATRLKHRRLQEDGTIQGDYTGRMLKIRPAQDSADNRTCGARSSSPPNCPGHHYCLQMTAYLTEKLRGGEALAETETQFSATSMRRALARHGREDTRRNLDAPRGLARCLPNGTGILVHDVPAQGSTESTRLFHPHPEEAARTAAVSKDEAPVGLMVRAGAGAPPHHGGFSSPHGLTARRSAIPGPTIYCSPDDRFSLISAADWPRCRQGLGIDRACRRSRDRRERSRARTGNRFVHGHHDHRAGAACPAIR